MRSRGLVVMLALVLATLATAGVFLYSRGVKEDARQGGDLATIVVSKVDIAANTDLNDLIRDEMNQRPYLRGTVGMALDWRDTGGSQFFITHSPAPHLDGRYTVFGSVVSGMDVVDRIVPWDRIVRVRVRDGISEE